MAKKKEPRKLLEVEIQEVDQPEPPDFNQGGCPCGGTAPSAQASQVP